MNNYGVFKKMISVVLLCCMMLSGGCSVIIGSNVIAASIGNKDNQIKYQIVMGSILISLGAFVDYSGYRSAQKYQEQGESKSKAYAKGGLVALGVYIVGLYLSLLGDAYYNEKIKKKH